MSNYTKWFPQKINPERVGVYQVGSPGNLELYWSLWDGSEWRTMFSMPSDAYRAQYRSYGMHHFKYMWRGLTKAQK